MLDTRNRAEPYRELAKECRRLATSAPSSQVKNRYLLMAQDYTWLADLKEQAHAYGAPARVEENAAWAGTMTGRFPGPWRIVEIPRGFAVDDATGQQLAVFYGLAEPDAARETDFLTIDEARQMAVDFAKLPGLLECTSGRSEVATYGQDVRDAWETWRLPRTAQLPAVAGLGVPTIVPKSSSFEPDEWVSAPSLPRPGYSLSNRTKFLTAIAIAVAALPAGYFIVRNSDRPAHIAAVPQATTDIPPVELSPSREARAPAAAAGGTNVESRAEPEVSLQQTAPLDTKPTIEANPAPLDTKRAASRIEARPAPSDTKPAASRIEARPAPSDTKPAASRIEPKPPPVLPETASFAAGRDASTCFPSASAVRDNHPGAWPSWTLRAPGHEGTRCWYAATRGSAHDHR